MTPPFPSKFHDISAYLAGQSGEGGRRVADICRRIEEDVPLAEGRLSYRMPAYFLEGSLVYFAAFKKHIGFYPASDTVFE